MCHIRTVIALSVLDEDLRPDQLGHTENIDVNVMNARRARAPNPFIGDRRYRVGSAEIHIDVVVASFNLCKPPLSLDVRGIAELGELVKNSRIVSRLAKDVDILRVAIDAGMKVDGITAANRKWDIRQ